jgi:hypothetical protein
MKMFVFLDRISYNFSVQCRDLRLTTVLGEKGVHELEIALHNWVWHMYRELGELEEEK